MSEAGCLNDGNFQNLDSVQATVSKDVNVGGNVVITGNLDVNGDMTTLSTTNTVVADALIKLGQTDTSTTKDLGLIFTRGDGTFTDKANRGLLWDAAASEFTFVECKTEDGTARAVDGAPNAGTVFIDEYAPLKCGGFIAGETKAAGGTPLTVSAAGAVTIESTLGVTGNTTITTLDASGVGDFAGALTCSAAGTALVVNNNATVGGNVDINGNILIQDDTESTRDLTITANNLNDNRQLTLTLTANSVLAMANNLTVEAESIINQDVTSDATPTFGGLSLVGDGAGITLKNNVAENQDGDAETVINFTDHENEVLGKIQVSHDGAADDTKGDFIVSTNNGTILTEALRIDSTQHASFSGICSINGTIAETVGVGRGFQGVVHGTGNAAVSGTIISSAMYVPANSVITNITVWVSGAAFTYGAGTPTSGIRIGTVSNGSGGQLVALDVDGFTGAAATVANGSAAVLNTGVTDALGILVPATKAVLVNTNALTYYCTLVPSGSSFTADTAGVLNCAISYSVYA